MALGLAMKHIEHTIGGFESGKLYALATRAGVGKTHFCVSVASHFAKLGKKVLYISNAMDADAFSERTACFFPAPPDSINFEEVYKLTLEGLKMFASDDNYDLIVIDPFDIYSWDLDIGELKEFAKQKGVPVLMTKHLSPDSADAPTPNLSHILFSTAEHADKFLAYTDVILLGCIRRRDDTICLHVAKNANGTIGTTLFFRR